MIVVPTEKFKKVEEKGIFFFLPYAGIQLYVILCELSLFNMIHIEEESVMKNQLF